jgi:hypothetical protein
MQPVQTASVAASKRVEVSRKTSIGQFGIIEKPHLILIQPDFTTLGAVLNMAKELTKISFELRNIINWQLN